MQILIKTILLQKPRLHYQSFFGQSPSKKTWSKFLGQGRLFTLSKFFEQLVYKKAMKNAYKCSKYVNILRKNFILIFFSVL